MEATKELENAVTELLVVTWQLTRRLRAVSNTRELTWSQVAIMVRLEEAGTMTTADLARAEAVKPQSMGGTLAFMEEEGLIERHPHPTDGRQIFFALTALGLETRQQVSLAKHGWLLNAVSKLTPAEQETLRNAADLFRRLSEL